MILLSFVLPSEEKKSLDEILISTKKRDCSHLEKKIHKIKKINLKNKGLKNMRPLAYFKSLIFLNFNENMADTIAPIENLEKLENIGISNNPITGLGDPAWAKRIKKIDLSDTFINSLDLFSHSTRLKWINIMGLNTIKPFSPYKKIKCLIDKPMALKRKGCKNIFN